MQADTAPQHGSDDAERAMVDALVRVAALEPETGGLRSDGWPERVTALQDLRERVVRWVRAQRAAGIAVETVVVQLKRIVHDTLSDGRRTVDIAPLRDKVVMWCAAAYFAEPGGA